MDEDSLFTSRVHLKISEASTGDRRFVREVIKSKRRRRAKRCISSPLWRARLHTQRLPIFCPTRTQGPDLLCSIPLCIMVYVSHYVPNTNLCLRSEKKCDKQCATLGYPSSILSNRHVVQLAPFPQAHTAVPPALRSLSRRSHQAAHGGRR